MRYQTNYGPRPEAAPAFMPQLPQVAGGRSTYWGASGVVGFPGTLQIPAPKPGVQIAGDHGKGPGQNSLAGAPDAILPSLYYVSGPASNAMAPPVRRRSDNVRPVPAGNMYQGVSDPRLAAGAGQVLPGISMRMRRTGGQNQVAQPGVVQRWPDLNARLKRKK